MAKPSNGFHTPRPTSICAAARSLSSSSSSSSSSAAKLPALTSISRDSPSKAVAKCLAYDDDVFIFPSAASPLASQVLAEGFGCVGLADLSSPLDLPDPDVAAGDTSSISAPPDDVPTGFAESSVTEISAPPDSTATSDLPVSESIKLVLAELQVADGVSEQGKRLLTALSEAALAELTDTATTRRLCSAAFWAKVRVGVLAAVVITVAAIDVALTVTLFGGRGKDYVLPPT